MGVIYKIRNVVNGKFYVGSTINQKDRFRNHRKLLRKNKHHCAHLQAAWNKYGEDCFKFEIVECDIPTEALQAAEDIWLEEHHGKEYCYNTGRRSDAPWRGVSGDQHPLFGVTRPEDVKTAISAKLKEVYAGAPENHPRYGVKHTEATLEKMKARTDIKRGEQHYRYGKTLSEEVRKKIGDAQRGVKKAPRVISEEGREKIRASAAAGNYSHQKGKKKSDAMRAKISKRVRETTTGKEFASLTETLAFYGMKMPTLTRALKSGAPISDRSPKFAGLVFEYVASGHPATLDV